MPTIDAVFRNGVFLPTGPVDLPDGARVSFAPEAGAAASPPRGWLDPRAFAGIIGPLPIDPLEYQRAIRAEWDRDPE